MNIGTCSRGMISRLFAGSASDVPAAVGRVWSLSRNSGNRVTVLERCRDGRALATLLNAIDAAMSGTRTELVVGFSAMMFGVGPDCGSARATDGEFLTTLRPLDRFQIAIG